MARLHTWSGHFTKIVDGIRRHNALSTVFFGMGLITVLVMVLVVAIIISDAINFLFNLSFS